MITTYEVCVENSTKTFDTVEKAKEYFDNIDGSKSAILMERKVGTSPKIIEMRKGVK